jgi:hypothetical protein
LPAPQEEARSRDDEEVRRAEVVSVDAAPNFRAVMQLCGWRGACSIHDRHE